MLKFCSEIRFKIRLGRSRGGWGTKIHMIADALGNPLAFVLTGSEQADVTQAPGLIEAVVDPQAVIADKGYDADALVASIERAGALTVIPPRSNRRAPRNFGAHRYRARHLIENLFARLKQFRRLAIRYDKLAQHFALSLPSRPSTCGWLNVSTA